MILYGASGHAKVIMDVLSSVNEPVEYLYDDDESIKQLEGIPVKGRYSSSFDLDKKIIISIGDNLIRKKLTDKIVHEFGTAIHRSALIARNSRINEGTVIFHGAIVQPGTHVGKHVIINTKASVDHDCNVGDYVHLAPGSTICGGVTIGTGSLIGAGAVVIPNISVGRWCTIGAGTVVIRDVPDFSVVVGIPGRIIRKSKLPV